MRVKCTFTSARGLLLLVISLLLVGCEACGPSLAELRNATETARRTTHNARAEGVHAAELDAVRAAIDVASPRVLEAVVGFHFSGESAFRATCAGLTARGELEEGLSCADEALAQVHNSIALREVRADTLVGLERFTEAREVLFSIRDEEPQRLGLQDRILASFTRDAMFLRPVVTMENGVHIDRIRALGGGSTVSFKFKLNDVNVAAFKPNQTRRQTNYRAEVAAYRLCPMIRCGFEVPYSFEARIERRAFQRLYGIRSLDPTFLETHTGYAANFVDLIWTRDEDGDTYLYGVWKDWVPHFTQFPIEYDDVWDSWVDVDGDPAELEQPLAETLRRLRGRERGHYTEILEEAGEITTRDLAAQISNMLAFDYLINNWDRFSGAYYGVNCQWANGHFVSIDNGAGFMTRDPDTPGRHLRQVTRFSRSFIQEVRLLDREALLPVLFPNPSDAELEKYESFWQRRDELLQYVDELIEEHGEDTVLFFE